MVRFGAVSPRSAAACSARSSNLPTISAMRGRRASMARPVNQGCTSLRNRVWSEGSRVNSDREAIVVEQGRHRHPVVVAGGQPDFGCVGVEGVGTGHKLRVHRIEHHRVREVAARQARVWLGQRTRPDHRLVGYQRSDRSGSTWSRQARGNAGAYTRVGIRPVERPCPAPRPLAVFSAVGATLSRYKRLSAES